MAFHYNRRKAIVCYAKSLRLKRELNNDLLNISPSVSQYEQWEKEAKAFPNIKALREWHKITCYGSWRDNLNPKRYITRRMWELRYINCDVCLHVMRRIDNMLNWFARHFKSRWIPNNTLQDHLFIVVE